MNFIFKIFSSLLFSNRINVKVPDVDIFFFLTIYSIVFLISFYTFMKSYKLYKATTDLKSVFYSLILIIFSFTLISFFDILDICIRILSSQNFRLNFLIPFLPVFFTLYGSNGIINQLVHRSKKTKSTFRIIKGFFNFSLIFYILVIVILIFGSFSNLNSIIRVFLVAMGFLIIEIVFFLIIIFIQKQKFELSSNLSKIRLRNVQIGYIGLIIYFLTLLFIYETKDILTNLIFVNLEVIASFIIIFFYYWSIIVPDWM